jgi:hypothetical protein
MSAASRPGRGFETRSSNVACNPPASVSGNAIGSSDKRVGWRIATDPPTGKLPWVHVPVSAMRRTRFCSAWRHYISALAKTWDFKKLHVESVRPGRLMRWSRHCSPPSIIPIPNGVSLWTQFRQIVVGSPLVGDRLRRRRSGHPSMLKASGMALKMCARPSREQSDASHAATTSLADQVRLL